MGDSHSVGHFGMKLDKLLREKYDQVQTIASCGSVAKWFFTGQKTRCGYYYKDLNGILRHGNSAPTPKLTSVLPKLKPESIIIALGANYTYASDSFMRSDIKRLLDYTESFTKNCLWVGPPHTRKNPERLPRLYKIIEEVVGKRCKIFKSHEVTTYPSRGSDGIHYWGKEGKAMAYKWATKVFDTFSATFPN